jgi:hypothetical protein
VPSDCLDNKLEEYTRAMAENDGDNQQIIHDEIEKQQQRKRTINQ